MKKIILAATLLCVGAIASAQDTSTSSALEFSREESQTTPSGLLPFIAIGGGYTGYDTFGAVEGTPATLKLLGSYYFMAPAVIDIGYGANNQQFTQSRGTTQETSITEGSAEVAVRYRWDNRWQAGVIANHLFEQGPVYTADQADAQFVGLQVLKEFNVSASWLARIGARAQNLTNNTDGQVTMYMVDLQLGWNPSAYRPSVRQTSEANPIEREPTSAAMTESAINEDMEMENNRVAPSRPVAATKPEPILRDVTYASLAGGTAIQFPSSRTTLTAQDRQRLENVAQVLADNKDLYERVEIYGYTDTTGSSDINQKISQQRANSVKSILQKNGVTNVVAKGRGSAESSGSMDEDRRAELVFIGVKDEAKLQEALSSVE